MNTDTFVCIEDFCGTDGHGYHVEYWADYDPKTGVVYFGGDWGDVPSMNFGEKPSAENLQEFVNAYLED